MSSYFRCELRSIVVHGYGLLKNVVAILLENLDQRLPILDFLLTLSDFAPQFRKLVVDIGGHDIVSCTVLLRVKRVVLARDGCSK
ncbi:hypothetical protein L6654_37840 [Bradyrhizobium sp. WYCCWR 13023]|uniref:Uncharacterized protein n=1 Tax=Bradyrhizobium zhengyangense TaxID=2911009 RepID=A0A9X1RLE7_9BRAD|nr:hypothetical protein [Bradyrhizobium zhengyangense]MCG2632380.1 hypothetical protein [Bradyrhizobium zhengyangense]